MSTECRVGEVTIELVVGDIVDQAGFDAVVNAANAELMPGGGVAGAIHRGAGRGLAEECRPLAPIRPGDCVLTSGHRLPNPYVLHCLGPIYGVDRPAADLLVSCYRKALDLAEEHDLTSVAFPAISAGAFGYPMDEAAELAIGAVVQVAAQLRSVRRVRFVLLDANALDIHREALDRLTRAG